MDTIGVSFLDPLEDYEIIQRIGSGTYGDVFKVRDTPHRIRDILTCPNMGIYGVPKAQKGDVYTLCAQDKTPFSTLEWKLHSTI